MNGARATVYDLVAGTGQIVENDECHIFQERAVIKRPVVETAVLVIVKDKCIRFLSRKSGLWRNEIESPIDGDAKVALPIEKMSDMHWSLKFSR